MSGNYILDESGTPVQADTLTWARWYEANSDKRQIARDVIGKAKVSTVFLSIDHSFGEGPPVLWETMIFGGQHDQYQERYTSKEEALEGHRRAVALVMNIEHKELQ